MIATAFALAALTTVAAMGFVRVFDEGSSAVAAVLVGLVVHGVLVAGRVRAWPLVGTAMALAGGLFVLLAVVVAPFTFVGLLPTEQTFAVLSQRLSDGLSELSTAAVPIGPHSGIVLVSALGAAAVALVADTVAFRARAGVAAAIPATTLFTITAALGTDRSATPLAAAFVGCGLAFVLAHAPAHAAGEHSWLRTARRGRATVLAAGLPIVVLAALLSPLLGPRLPEARSAGLIDLAPAGGGPSSRVTVSPLVDIRDRLVQEPPVEAFRVTADRPAYWRLAALETYDGTIWSSLADYKRSEGSIPDDGTAAAVGSSLFQNFEITGLAQFWLPAAYRPISIDLRGARANPGSLTLLTENETADGLRYSVLSDVPEYSASDLDAGTGQIPEAVLPMLDVPDGAPSVAASLALEVTAGATTVAEQASALQNWFRSEFRYSEDVPAGHTGDHMAHFLTQGRAGYCEQFSSSFAVMARTLGIPARVAVGFTPGALDDSTGAYTVTSREAHAWPEVWIDPFGWVAFEPTPTRFHPSPANHTGTFEPGAQESPSTPATQPAEPLAVPEPETADPASLPEPGPEAGGDGGESGLPALALALAIVAFGGAGSAVALVRRRRRGRVNVSDLEPPDAILAAWDDLLRRLAKSGLDVPASMTPTEASVAAAGHVPDLEEPVERLRHLVDRAAYAPAAPDAGDAARAWSEYETATAVLLRPGDR